MRVFAGVAVVGAVVWFLLAGNTYRIDLDVYRIAVQTWLDGGDLYGELPPTEIGVSLPFIYPPISAALLTPFAVVPFPLANAMLTLLTFALVAVVLAITLNALGLARTWLLAAPVALLLEPIRSTIDYGQINVIVLALTVADCLVKKPRWPRGLLIGLAAAIKLTPLAFLLLFLVRRDYRAAVTAVASFAAISALGFLVAGKESVAFWTDAVFHTGDRVGIPYISNQSILGVLSRAGLSAGWPILAIAVVVAAFLAMRRTTLPMAFSVNAVAMLLISPISWSHHWVWCLPLLLTLATHGYRTLAVTGTILFTISPHWWFPTPPAATWQQLPIAAYFLYALITLTTIAIRETREQPIEPIAAVARTS